MSADRRTRCRRCPGRTCAGTPTPPEPSLRERLGAPGHHPHHAQAGLCRGRAQDGRSRSKPVGRSKPGATHRSARHARHARARTRRSTVTGRHQPSPAESLRPRSGRRGRRFKSATPDHNRSAWSIRGLTEQMAKALLSSKQYPGIPRGRRACVVRRRTGCCDGPGASAASAVRRGFRPPGRNLRCPHERLRRRLIFLQRVRNGRVLHHPPVPEPFEHRNTRSGRIEHTQDVAHPRADQIGAGSRRGRRRPNRRRRGRRGRPVCRWSPTR